MVKKTKSPPEETKIDGKLKRQENLKKFGEPGGNLQASKMPEANKPWSVRNSVRYLASQEVDVKDRNLQKIIGKRAKSATIIAAKQIQRAMTGDTRAAEYVTEQVDGKLAQTNLNADVAAIQGMTDEELNDIITRAYHAIAAPSDTSGNGKDTPQGRDSDDAREDEGD